VIRRLIIIAIALLLGAGPAFAKKDPEGDPDRKTRARALLKEGRARYDLGKFDEAIRLFETSYEVYPYPEALFNLGQCHRQLKNFERAVFYYRAYLRNKPEAKNRDEVEQLITEMEALDKQQKEQAEKPPAGTAEPGVGEPKQGPVDPVKEPVKAPVSEPVREPPSPQVEMVRARWYEDKWGWTAAGVGVVSLGIGLGYLKSADTLRGELAGASTESERLQLREDADSHESIGLPLAIAGGVITAGGVFLLAWNPGEERVVPSVSADSGRAWVFVSGTF
jgi:tetratricopeptide (TPR) repeat protein